MKKQMLPKFEFQQRPILVFDVNETLLDVQTLRPLFESIFGNGAVLNEWFSRTLLYTQTVTQTGTYVDFTTVARHTLEMTARIHAVRWGEAKATAIMGAIKTLPVHPEVPGGLRRLQQNGFRLIALTNSAQSVVESQMHSLGLDRIWERIFSADAVRKYKPHPEPYRYVAKELQVDTTELMMVAAHPWDLMGAQAVGCEVAFVERTGAAWFGLTTKPKITGKNLDEVANQLISAIATK